MNTAAEKAVSERHLYKFGSCCISLSLSVYQPPNTHLLRGEPLFPSKLLNRKTVKALHREKTSLLRLFFMQFGGGIIGGCGLVNMQGGRKWWWVKLPPSRGPPNTIPTTRRLEDRGFLHFGLGNSDFCSRYRSLRLASQHVNFVCI